MDWKSLTSSVAPLGQRLSQRFGTLNQQAREHFGSADDITELPEEYRQLERRVDALKAAHGAMVRTVKTFEHEGYDYPNHLQETFSHGAQSLGHTLSTWASAAAKHTSLPAVDAPPSVSRTLSHALSRSAASAAIDLGASAGDAPESKLGELLQQFAVAQDAIGSAQLVQDRAIVNDFLVVWNAFGAQIQLALRARAGVRDARLHLDAWRQSLKGAEAAGGARAESVRAEVEHAEDELVSATEEAISLMKTVLENPEPIKSLALLVRAQLEFHRAAVASLDALYHDMSGVATGAEAEFRESRT